MKEKIKNSSLIKAIIIVVIIIGLACLGIKLYANHLIKLYENETNKIISLAKDYVQLNQVNEDTDIFLKLDKHEKVTDGAVYVNEYNEVAAAIIYDDIVCYIKLYNNDSFITNVNVDYCKQYLNIHIIQYEYNNGNDENGELRNNNSKFYSENLTKDAYAYVVVDNDNGSELYELRKNNVSAKVASCTGKCGIYGLNTSGNKVNFYIHYFKDESTNNKSSDEVVSIDLTNPNFEIIVQTEKDFIHGGSYYAVSDNYVFTPNEDYQGIKRLDIKTGEVDILNPNVKCDNMFIYNDKLYTAKFISWDDVVESPYTIDFEGNITEITLNDYEQALKQANYIEDGVTNYYYYADSKILLKNNKSLVYNDEVIYTAQGNANLRLYFSKENNYVIFEEYEKLIDAEIVIAYYKYNLDNKKMEKYSSDISFKELGTDYANPLMLEN